MKLELEADWHKSETDSSEEWRLSIGLYEALVCMYKRDGRTYMQVSMKSRRLFEATIFEASSKAVGRAKALIEDEINLTHGRYVKPIIKFGGDLTKVVADGS